MRIEWSFNIIQMVRVKRGGKPRCKKAIEGGAE